MHPAFREELLRDRRRDLESGLRFAPHLREDEVAAQRRRRSLRARVAAAWSPRPCPPSPNPEAA